MQKFSSIISNLKKSVDFSQPVLISFLNTRCIDFVNELCDEILAQKGTPLLKYNDEKLFHKILLTNDKKIISEYVDNIYNAAKNYKNFIRISDEEDPFLLNDVQPETLQYYRTIRANGFIKHMLKHNWVLLNYPAPEDAKIAGMDYDNFYNVWLNATGNPITQDFQNAMENLKALMDKTTCVKIVGDDVDLQFTKQNIPAVVCSGECNLPDGEVYTAPEKFSANGYIKFDYKTIYNYEIFDWIKLYFENGKIISFETTQDKMEQLKLIFDTDDGAKYIGEFAFGLNKEITKPICDILFDEKIAGSIHMAIGSCYEKADNGNESAIHWDLVRSNHNTEIYFDDVLIRKDGKFTIDELKDLN
jgi:aminopeptidase